MGVVGLVVPALVAQGPRPVQERGAYWYTTVCCWLCEKFRWVRITNA